MSGGLIDFTLVSASIAPFSSFDSEPCSTYAVLKCAGDHQRTNHAEDQGRLPVWNESFSFEIQPEHMSSELVVQVFNINRESDELLGIGRLPILDMLGKEEATLCALINPVQGEIGKLKAAWKWKPGAQMSHKARWDKSGSASEARPPVSKQSSTNTSERLGKLEAVSDALAKLSMRRDSEKYSSPYAENLGNFGKEEKAQKGEYYPYPSAPDEYSVAHQAIPEPYARAEGFNYAYPPPASGAYTPEKHASHTHSSGVYPPPADAYPPTNQGYPQSSPGSAYQPSNPGYPPSNQGYPPSFSGSVYPPPPSTAYPPGSAMYPPLAAPYPPSEEIYYDPDCSSDLQSGGFPYTEMGGGIMEKGGSGKDKGKKHGSYATYGQTPQSGYSASLYPPAHAEYPPGGYPPAQHGYPQALHGYPPASHGYPPESQGYSPAVYPPQYPPVHSGSGYPPQGYPSFGHADGHKSDKHGYTAGSYVGHSSSTGKPSKEHKEPKHLSSHKHDKAKKQESFKGLNFKKFEMFKY